MSTKNTSVGVLIGGAVGPSLGNSFRTVTEQHKRLGDALRRSRIGQGVTKDVIRYSSELAKLRRQQKTTGADSAGLAGKISKAELALKRAEKQAGKYGVTLGNATRQQRRFERSARDSERAIERLGAKERNRARLGGLRGKALGVGAAAYGASRALRGPLDFERASTRLETVLPDKDIEKNLLKAKNHAVNFARKNITNETEMLNIQYALNSAGLGAAASRIGSEIVAKTSVITNGVPERVAEVVATTFNNLGASLEGSMGDKLVTIGDLLTKTQLKFQLRDFNQLGESMKTAAPTLAQYNVDLSQAVTLLGQLNSAGLQGSEGGTAFKATMRNMSKASDELGFELMRNDRGGLDVIETFKAMSDAIGGFEGMDQETNDELQKLFGDEGIAGVILLGQKLNDLEAAQKDVNQSFKGAVDTQYAKFLDDFGGQLDVLKNQAGQLGRVFVETFIPALQSSIGPITNMLGNTAQMIQANPELGKTILGVAAGFLLLKSFSMVGVLGLTAMSSGVIVLGGLMRFMKGGIGLAATAIGLLGRALFLNPIGMAVTLIASSAALLINNWEPARDFFMKFWEPIKRVWGSAVDWVSKKFNIVAKPLGFVTDTFDKLVDAADPEGSIQKKIEQFFSGESGVKAGSSSNKVDMKFDAPITIHAAPGMDVREVGEQVKYQLDEMMQQWRTEWGTSANG